MKKMFQGGWHGAAWLLRPLSILLFSFLSLWQAGAQRVLTSDDRDLADHFAPASDSLQKEDVPEGIYVWRVDEQFGYRSPAQPDTLMDHFPGAAFTSGTFGHYNYTGNLGAPRLSRLYFDRPLPAPTNDFIFAAPYDFFVRQPGDLLYTNTKSPFTNLTYHECGNKTNGEDRFTAKFATNAGRKAGFGFIFDYLYGRGYYNHQANSQMKGLVYASFIDDRYSLHFNGSTNYLKTSENGGLEDDIYVTNPEALSTSYATEDMPTRLEKTWSKMHLTTFYLTHRYNLGYKRYVDSQGRTVHVNRDETGGLISKTFGGLVDNLTADGTATAPLAPDTARTVLDSLRQKMPEDLHGEFIPVASIVHTARLDINNRRFLSNDGMNAGNSTYWNDFYLPGDSANDYTTHFRLRNQLALEINEGFSRWVKSGLTLYAAYEYERFSLPSADLGRDTWHRHFIYAGARLSKHQGRYFHYDVSGETRTDGGSWGEFFVHGKADFNLPLFGDTLHVAANGHLRNERPSFYFLHYQGRNAWWDNATLDKILSTRVSGTLSFADTRLTVSIEDIQNHTFFQEHQTLPAAADPTETPLPLYGVSAQQSSKNIQVIAATLSNKLRFGIFRWHNELTYQISSDKDLLPLPTFNAYSNFYVDFRIARVLHTQIGADLRYFTKYYAPAYSPAIGQYALQDADARIKIGNYPVACLYANFHLKRTRFYVMASHVNHSRGRGYPFFVPGYPLNERVLRLGVSWNFVN